MQRVTFRTGLVVEDMTALGWQSIDLARRCQVAPSTVTRFLSGQRQTARVAAKIAKALRRPIERYVIREAA